MVRQRCPGLPDRLYGWGADCGVLSGCEDHIAKEMTDRTEAGVWSGGEMGLNVRSGNYLDAAVLGTALMGIAGEQAEKFPAAGKLSGESAE